MVACAQCLLGTVDLGAYATGGRLFMRSQEPREFKENDVLSFLLTLTPRFDQRM